ncbi:MAG: nucleotidyl transferase AbiEii/AbiGii toxin family protein [Candidatus Diapherotrites archaeon]|nr:nucleotidyl transferase AbiEii/AbiGii toxin family protein [Candidatus Diapherotrites archaeon]
MDILEILAKQSRLQKHLLVFIGGSAVQSSIPKPQRLSIDLDLYYDGEPETLLSALKPEYIIEKRPVKNQDLFYFFEATKGNTLSKIDIARFSLLEKGKPFQTKTIQYQSKDFRANIATFDYLLASKFSSLAVGTVGRKKDKTDFQMNLLKDMFDAHCLLEQTKTTQKTWAYFEQIVKLQNRIRKTGHSVKESLDSALQTLNESIQSATLKGTLQNFNQYLLVGSVSKPAYWQMAYRLMAYLNAYNHNSKTAFNLFSNIEKRVNQEYANRAIVSEYENQLRQKGINAEHLHELKILSPKSLVYLYAFVNPQAFDVMAK